MRALGKPRRDAAAWVMRARARPAQGVRVRRCSWSQQSGSASEQALGGRAKQQRPVSEAGQGEVGGNGDKEGQANVE